MKNKLLATFLLALLVVSGLFVLHFLPPMSVGGKPLRKVDLLSDIRVDKVLPADSDTLLLPPPVRRFRMLFALKMALTHSRDSCSLASTPLICVAISTSLLKLLA